MRFSLVDITYFKRKIKRLFLRIESSHINLIIYMWITREIYFTTIEYFLVQVFTLLLQQL